MLNRIVIDNMLGFIRNGNIIGNPNIDITFETGKPQIVDPRVPDFLEYLKNSIVLHYSSKLDIDIAYAGIRPDAIDPEEFIRVSLEYGNKYRYCVTIDPGYYTDTARGGVFLESLETLDGEVLQSYSYLDVPWENGKPSPRKLLLGKFKRDSAFECLSKSFHVAEWGGPGYIFSDKNIKEVRNTLKFAYGMSDEFISRVWKDIITHLDLGITQVTSWDGLYCDGKELIPSELGSVARVLLYALPIFLCCGERTIVTSRGNSLRHVLHPDLEEHIFKDIVFKEFPEGMILIRDED